MSKRITVPLALDAELQMSYPGLGNLPMRSVIGVLLILVPILVLVVVGTPLGLFRYLLGALMLMVTLVITIPKVDNVWIGTQWIYRHLDRWLPSGTARGEYQKVSRKWHGDLLSTGRWTRSTSLPLRSLRQLVRLPHLERVEEGLFEANPGGYRAVLALRGPDASVGSDLYDNWSHSVMLWLDTLEVPVQLYAVIDNYDESEALRSFDERVSNRVRRSPLIDAERDLVRHLAASSFEVQTYIVLDPGMAGGAGNPYGSWVLDASSWTSTPRELAVEKASSALRTADSFGVKTRWARKEEILSLLQRTPLGAEQTICTERAVSIKNGNTTYHIPNVVTKPPRTLGAGDLIDVLMQTRTKALVNVTMIPMSNQAARKKLDRIIKARNYAAQNKGPSAVEDPMVAAEGQAVLELLAQGVKPINLAISCSVIGSTVEEAEDAEERFIAQMSAKGMGIVHARQPGLWPMLACTPGGAPLRRSLILTMDMVAERLIPSIGTCFNDPHDALVGLNLFTGAPAYWDVWGNHGQANNHNMLMLATSGAGKSVTLKTMLYRHAVAGTNFVVIDPDSEYRQLVAAVGGDYYELGTHALNAFAAALHYDPVDAAAVVLPVLAVMAGDTSFDAHGQPVRRMKDEDKSWMYDQLRQFFSQLQFGRQLSVEPVLQDFVDYMETRVQNRARNEQEAERARKIQERLSYYCKGSLAQIFNRRSTFELGERPVGVGFKKIINSYAADITPALVVVMSAIYTLMTKARQSPFLVVVDEASHLTSNPDAGQVLEQIARRGRKAGMGVWMASQELGDFLDTHLGKALSAVSSTKWILGCQEETLKEVGETFGLNPEEMAALNPIRKGFGVLLSDSGDRAVVSVMLSAPLMSLVSTTPSSVEGN